MDWRPGGGSGLYTPGWPRPALNANLGFRPPAWVASTDRPPVERALDNNDDWPADSWEDPDEEEESPGTWPYGQRSRLGFALLTEGLGVKLETCKLAFPIKPLRLGVVSYFQNCMRRVENGDQSCRGEAAFLFGKPSASS